MRLPLGQIDYVFPLGNHILCPLGKFNGPGYTYRTDILIDLQVCLLNLMGRKINHHQTHYWGLTMPTIR